MKICKECRWHYTWTLGDPAYPEYFCGYSKVQKFHVDPATGERHDLQIQCRSINPSGECQDWTPYTLEDKKQHKKDVIYGFIIFLGLISIPVALSLLIG